MELLWNDYEKWAEGTGGQGQQNENNEWSDAEFGDCLLTINPIDGSVIDRAAGY